MSRVNSSSFFVVLEDTDCADLARCLEHDAQSRSGLVLKKLAQRLFPVAFWDGLSSIAGEASGHAGSTVQRLGAADARLHPCSLCLRVHSNHVSIPSCMQEARVHAQGCSRENPEAAAVTAAMSELAYLSLAPHECVASREDLASLVQVLPSAQPLLEFGLDFRSATCPEAHC